jgi:hypothetical protein
VKERFVPKFWHANSSAKSNTGSYHTDGAYLYSGKKMIGTTNGYGQKILYNYTKSDEGTFLSALVSRHVNMARFYADEFVSTRKN